jgi:hypothetical protein
MKPAIHPLIRARAWRVSIDEVEASIRSVLDKAVAEKRELTPDAMKHAVWVDFLKRMSGRIQPSLEMQKLLFDFLFDPGLFDDDLGVDPLAALEVFRKEILPGAGNRGGEHG